MSSCTTLHKSFFAFFGFMCFLLAVSSAGRISVTTRAALLIFQNQQSGRTFSSICQAFFHIFLKKIPRTLVWIRGILSCHLNLMTLRLMRLLFLRLCSGSPPFPHATRCAGLARGPHLVDTVTILVPTKKPLLSTWAKEVSLLFYEDEHGTIYKTNHYLRGIII